MTRHRFDGLSFVFGLVFVVLAVAGFTGPWPVRPVDLAWAGPAVLIVLGVVVLLSGARRGEERRQDGPEAGPGPGRPDPDGPGPEGGRHGDG